MIKITNIGLNIYEIFSVRFKILLFCFIDKFCPRQNEVENFCQKKTWNENVTKQNFPKNFSPIRHQGLVSTSIFFASWKYEIFLRISKLRKMFYVLNLEKVQLINTELLEIILRGRLLKTILTIFTTAQF